MVWNFDELQLKLKITLDYINSLVSNPSIDNDIYDIQNRNIFLFDNDEFNSINVEPQNNRNENNNVNNDKIDENNNINKDNGLINNNNIKDSLKSNSSNFSFKCFMKNDQINNLTSYIKEL